MTLRALASINVGVIERNVVLLRRKLHGPTELCAVVKADADLVAWDERFVAASAAAARDGEPSP